MPYMFESAKNIRSVFGAIGDVLGAAAGSPRYLLAICSITPLLRTPSSGGCTTRERMSMSSTQAR